VPVFERGGFHAGVAELADAQDLKSWVAQAACGFDSRPRQIPYDDLACFVDWPTRDNRQPREDMTRFKELRRIERAIENLDATDLEWSAQYCRLRLSFILTKQGGVLWRRLAKQVEDALKQIKSK
jgi:hypothetical protein